MGTHSADIIKAAAARPEILLVASAGLMAVAGLLIWTNFHAGVAPLHRGGGSENAQGAPVEAVTARRAIHRGETIAVADLSVRGLLGAAPPRLLTSVNAAAGHVALSDLNEGQILFSDSVGADPASAGLAPLVPEGMRAYAVRVAEEDIVGGFVRPGDHVDVFVTVPGSAYARAEAAGSADRSKGGLLLQDVAVLALGGNLEDEKNVKTHPDARTVTLALAPSDLARLALAARIGRIALAIRNPADTARVAQVQAALPDLLALRGGADSSSQAPVAQAAKPSPPGHGTREHRIIFYSGVTKSVRAVAP